MMVNYVMYNAAINTTVSLSPTGKGRIVAIYWSLQQLGGAAVGVNGFSLVKNTTPNTAATWAINGPQKNMVLMNYVNRTGTTEDVRDSGALEGLALEYNIGDQFQLLNLNNGGTAPASSILMVNLYGVE